MECLIGIKCNDFVLLAADGAVAHSIMVLKQDEQKITKLSDSLAMAVVGESGDTVQFADYIAKNITLYKTRNGYELSPKAAATFTRKNLADSLRSRNAYRVSMSVVELMQIYGRSVFHAYIVISATVARLLQNNNILIPSTVRPVVGWVRSPQQKTRTLLHRLLGQYG